MTISSIAFGIAAMALTASAMAVEVGGISVNDRAVVGGKELVLNGAGIRTRAIFKVYVGSLYIPAKAPNLAAVLAQAPRRIQLNLLRNLSGDQLTDAVNDGLRANLTAAEVEALKSETDQFVAMVNTFGELKEGGVVTLDFFEGATRVGFNGAVKGTIAGDAFNRALTKIWLGEKPAQADLKSAMLGG